MSRPYFLVINGCDVTRWYRSDAEALEVLTRWHRLFWPRYVASLPEGSLARDIARRRPPGSNGVIRLTETYPGSGVIACEGREWIEAP